MQIVQAQESPGQHAGKGWPTNVYRVANPKSLETLPVQEKRASRISNVQEKGVTPVQEKCAPPVQEKRYTPVQEKGVTPSRGSDPSPDPSQDSYPQQQQAPPPAPRPQQQAQIPEPELLLLLKSIFGKEAEAEKAAEIVLAERADNDRVKKALAVLASEAKAHTIANPIGFFRSALQKGWETATSMSIDPAPGRNGTNQTAAQMRQGWLDKEADTDLQASLAAERLAARAEAKDAREGTLAPDPRMVAIVNSEGRAKGARQVLEALGVNTTNGPRRIFGTPPEPEATAAPPHEQQEDNPEQAAIRDAWLKAKGESP